MYDAPAAAERQVFVTVKSATRSEHYAAMSHGFTPDHIFKLAVAEDYEDERLCRYRGKVFSILRTYETDDGGIELTVQRSDENA